MSFVLVARRQLAWLIVAAGMLGCRSNTIVDGEARFQILTPSLIRFEFAADRRFENGTSFNRGKEPLPKTRFTTRVRDEWREIETDELAIRYLRGSGPFTPDNLIVTRLRDQSRSFTPFGITPAHPLGGWLRALDSQNEAVPMHDGLLNRDGWYLLDDTQTAVRTRDGWLEPRRQHDGAYQDQYLFVYGHDYARGLADFIALSGRPPLLPRWAFGIWYSRYYPYPAAEYREKLLPRFRDDHVPIDVLVVDTDWKAPHPNNGWSWNATLFPDGNGFLKWAAGQGLQLTLNIHPSIAGDDPRFNATNRDAGGLTGISGGNFVWDWGNRKQAAAYFALHDPFDGNGVRFWWLDWCCEPGIASVPGADGAELAPPDSWINSLYAERSTARGLRGFSFARIGGRFAGYNAVGSQSPTGPWPDHRYTVHFTGDTFPTWKMLAFEVVFTVAEGATGFPYVSHDIGSFFGKHLPDDLYLRWVQLGVFQPIFRLHSHHGDRLPWDYPDPIRVAAERLMQLRESLVPYLYTLSRVAFDTGLPLTRGLFFAYPDDEPAYTHKNEFLLGDALLVMPITSPDGKSDVWFPPGAWIDVFTHERITGPVEQTISAPLETIPLFARAGAIIPRQPPMSHVGERPVDPLLLDVYVGADGAFELYEDEGEGQGYLGAQLRRTAMRYRHAQRSLTVEPAAGAYAGAPTRRAYEIEFIGVDGPPARVIVDGDALSANQWRYDGDRHAVQLHLPAHAVDRRLSLELL